VVAIGVETHNKTINMEGPYVHRDISWLSFNYRVLQEAKDMSVPLLERLKFMAIYSNNLDEFFRVRVAHHRNLVRVGKKTKKKLDFAPNTVLERIMSIVHSQQLEFSEIFGKQIIPDLAKHGIRLVRSSDLNDEQKTFIDTFFRDRMLPFMQPVLLVKNRIRPFLNNGALYLTLHLKAIDKDNPKSEYALVEIPSDHVGRFLTLPTSDPQNHDVIILDDVVRHTVGWLFPGYEIVNSFSIKLTRDAELYIDDEFSGDLIQKIRKSLVKRNVGPTSRLIYDREMNSEIVEFLCDVFELDEFDLLEEGRYHNNSDFFKFPHFDKSYLRNLPHPPLKYLPLESGNFFETIEKRDHLIFTPYQSYESVIQFFEVAANDPQVTHIKIIQYRVAKESRIMDALIQAVQAGKMYQHLLK
jgi:polyphosphate kinase